MAPTLLDVADLACRRGGRPVFDRLSFALGAGELLALTGRNGSGKTTLLRALALLVRPEAGTILWQGANVQDDPETWRGRLAWLGHLDGLKGDLTVRENLLGAERLRGRPAADDRLDLALVAFDLACSGASAGAHAVRRPAPPHRARSRDADARRRCGCSTSR